MHVDVRYRGGLAIDLMEPVRPIADELVLDLLENRELCRGDVVETRRGVCRLGPQLAREVARSSVLLRGSVSPHAERLASVLLRSPQHPTPLIRRRHREAVRARDVRSVASPFVVYERVRESSVAGSLPLDEAGETATAGPQGPL
jgi:CRISPR associated protein, Cas1 family